MKNIFIELLAENKLSICNPGGKNFYSLLISILSSNKHLETAIFHLSGIPCLTQE